MDRLQTLGWRYVLRMGALAGIGLLYLGVIGMMSAFNEREIIREGLLFGLERLALPSLTLGQFLVIVPALLGGYMTARKLREEQQPPWVAIVSAMVVGLLSALPSLIVLAFNNQVEVRGMFVNISRDWIDIITFDNRRELLKGSLIMVEVVSLTGLVAGIWSQLPEKVRQALIFGTALMLVVGVMGQTMRLILQENFPRDVLDIFFRRDTLLLNTAVGLFALGTVGAFLWLQFGRPAADNYNPKREEIRVIHGVRNAVLIAILLSLPWLVGRALSDVMVTIGLFVLMGLGLNIAIGLAGLLDLGYVTNYAVGAYVMAVLTSTGPLGRGGFLNFWLVIPIALLAALFAGFFFAVPVLKMRGDYLAIATLGFGEIIGRLAISDALAPLIGGAQGVLFIPKPNLVGIELKNPEQLYYVVLGACLVTLLVSIRLNNSRTGRQWMAMREDEDAASAMGINVAQAKLLAFTLSAATGGVAGAIFATKVGTVFPNSFTVFISINVLSLIIVGGIGSNPGIIIGAIVLMGLPELLREFSEFRWLMYGALLVWMMVNRPEGLWPSQVRRRELQGNGEPLPDSAAAAQAAGD